MPSRMRSRTMDSELLDGPSVQTILALRGEMVALPSRSRAPLIQWLSFFTVAHFRINLRVEFRTQQHDDRHNIEPHQQRNGCAQRSVDHAISRIVRHVPAKEHGSG